MCLVFSVVLFSTSKIIHLLRFKLFLTIFKCIYVSFFYINCLQNPNTYVLLSIKKYFLSWNQKYTCVLFCFSFLEILASCILTFSSCGCKRGITCRSQGSYWPLWPQCHLGSVENNNPRHSLSARASASVSRTMFIHPHWIPFHRSSVA